MADFATENIAELVASGRGQGPAFHEDSDSDNDPPADPLLARDGGGGLDESIVSADGDEWGSGHEGERVVSIDGECGGAPASPRPPPPVDRYGFFLDAEKTALALPEREVARRAAREEIRVAKWAAMMAQWERHASGGGKRSAAAGLAMRPKLKRRIRKGIPDSLRGEVRAAAACPRPLQCRVQGGGRGGGVAAEGGARLA